MIPKKRVGILSYGVAIPRYRITAADIALAHGRAGHEKSLGIKQKAVAAQDQDTATLSVDAARQALLRVEGKVNIGAVYIGSESHPYAVKPTGGIVGEALGLDHGYTTADFEFACKAGTAAVQTAAGLVGSEMIEAGLAIGADVAQSKAGDPLEYAAAAGAGAFIIGPENRKLPLIAELLTTVSRTYDVPDFWRRPQQKEPSHGGRFTGKPAYFRLIQETVEQLLNTAKMNIKNIDHVVFHMPNTKFAHAIGRRLSVQDRQLATGLTVTDIGNAYSACSLIGFAKVLDQAKSGETILVCSFGSGAGSDGFIWRTTDALMQMQKSKEFGDSVQDQIDTKEMIDYIRYTKLRGKIV